MEGSKNSHSVEEANIGEKNSVGNIIKGSETECNPPENKAKLKKLCRLCARTDKEMHYIFNNDGSKHSLAYKINACLPIQNDPRSYYTVLEGTKYMSSLSEQYDPEEINIFFLIYRVGQDVRKTDPLPKQLCTTCIDQLNTAFEFSECCVEAEDKLNSRMDRNLFQSRSMLTTKARSFDKVPRNSLDKKSSERNEYRMTDNKENILNSLINAIDKCSHNLQNTSSNLESDITKDFKKEGNVLVIYKPSSSNKSNAAKNSRPAIQRECNDKENVFKIINNNVIKENSNTDLEIHSKENNGKHLASQNDFDKTLTSSDLQVDEEQTVENNKNLKMSCPLCNKGTMKVKKISEIEDTDMNKDTYIWDSTCYNDTGNEQSPNEDDPDSCDENFVEFSNFEDKVEFHSCGKEEEYEREGDTLSENPITCLICKMKFSSMEHCIVHSESHSSENAYHCCICGMSFTSRHVWQSHCNTHEVTNAIKRYDPLRISNSTSQIFNTEEEESHKPKHIYKCEICVKLFSSEISLQYHHSNFHSGIPICCEICNKCCDTPSEYFDHMKNCHARNDSSYNMVTLVSEKKAEINTIGFICFSKCGTCGEQFQNNELLQEHYNTHIITCELCSYCTTDEESLKIHIILAHLETLPLQSCFKCSVCKEVFAALQRAVTHTLTHSRNTENEDLLEVHIYAMYQCEYCLKCFADKHDLIQHYKEHTGKKIYICKICRAMFYNSSQVEIHQTLHNTDSSHSEVEFELPRLFFCLECDRIFLQWDTALEHYGIHNGTYKILNNQLQDGLSYRNRHTYVLEDKTNKLHFLTYRTDDTSKRTRKGKSYMCSVCGEVFRLKTMFDKHFRIHSNERPFFCETCGRTFSHKSGLYTHRRMHTGERPYPCDICNKSFRLKHDRDNHRRVHTGERPYKCANCEKAFRTSHDHRQHQLIHTGERPYLCLTCGKGFRRINGLNVHKRIHTGEKPYGCEACGRHFTQKGDMLKHRKTQHGLL